MTWADYWRALQEIHALPVAGLTFLIVGGLFRWFMPLSRWLGTPVVSLEQAWWIKAQSRDAIKTDPRGEAAVRRGEERARDHVRRLSRYGTAMMIVGAVVFLLAISLL